MASDKKFKYSELFGETFQGEGKFTGVPTVWVRFWGCNFECNGFGQDDPTNPASYQLHYQEIDVSSIKKMTDLPVFNTGCDSSYSWAKKFAHLAESGTASEICDRLEGFMKNEFNPEGKFLHPKSKQWTHLAFTGGEPMMNQTAIVEIMLEFARRGNMPKFVTVETNGTQEVRSKFANYLRGYPVDADGSPEPYDESFNYDESFYMGGRRFHASENLVFLSEELEAIRGIDWFWSVSPKLYLSGEQWDDAIQPDVVASYKNLSNSGQLKFVCDGSDRAWDEIERATKLYRDAGVNWEVTVMPVGATVEGQEKVQAAVAVEAIRRGYNVSARVHCFVFGNSVGK